MSQTKEIAILRSLNPTKEFKFFVRATDDKTEWYEIINSSFGSGNYRLSAVLQEVFECCTVRDQIRPFPIYRCFPRFVCGFISMVIVDDAGLRWNSANIEDARETNTNVCF